MSFWFSQTGPRFDGDARGDASERSIGVVVCPDCENVLARLLETSDGVGLRAWVPAPSPGLPGNRRSGYQLWTPVTENEPADADGSVLNCWKGHGGLWVTGELCREIERLYRERRREVRRPALRVPEEQIPSE